MTIDLFVPEFLFFTPIWQAADCSIFDHYTGRKQLFCHTSQRLVAVVSESHEAELLVIRNKMFSARNIRARLSLLGKDEKLIRTMEDYFRPHVSSYLRELRRLGVDDNALAPEIAGSNGFVNSSGATHSVIECLGGRNKVVIDWNKATIVGTKAGGDAETPSKSLHPAELDFILKTLFSDKVVLPRARADVDLGNGEIASAVIDYNRGLPSRLTISREKPDYPGYIAR